MLDALVVVLSVSLYAGLVLAPGQCRGFWSGDAGVKLWQMETWIVNGWRSSWATYADVNVPLDPAGHLAPMEEPFVVWDGNRFLTVYTQPHILMSSLLLARVGRVGLYVLPVAAGAVGLLLQSNLGHKLCRRIDWLAVSVLGLATPWLFYSVVFWGHTLASVLVWTGLVLLLPRANIEDSHGLVKVSAGLCLGGAVVIRPEAAACALALLILLVLQRSPLSLLVRVTAGVVLAGASGYAAQVVLTGRPILSHISLNYAASSRVSELGVRLVRNSQIVVETRHNGVCVVVLGLLAILVIARIYRRLSPEAGLIVESAGLVVFAAATVILLFRGHRPIGLVTGAPAVSLLFLKRPNSVSLGASSHLRDRLARWCLVEVALVLVLAPNDGGSQWGPRYLVPVLGPLVLLGVDKWHRLKLTARSELGRRAVTGAFAALVLAGIVTQAVGVVYLWQTRSGNDTLTRVLLRTPTVPVVTDVWYVPQIAPDVYGRVPLLLIQTTVEWRELMGRLAEEGVERVRLVRLPGAEIASQDDIALHCRSLLDTGTELPTEPPLLVVDCAPLVP
jgi:hypothetical protein